MKRTSANFLKYVMCGLLSVSALASTAQAWWNDEWTLRRKITIDTTEKGVAIADPVGGTPALVRLHDGSFQFPAAKDDGSDIRFVAADDKTLLKHHVEKFDPLFGEAFVWVNVPDVKPGAQTTFWMYYGNSTGKAVKIDDAKGTYDADTVLVYHFAGKGVPASDYSPAGNNAQNAGVGDDSALIGGGLRLDGKTLVTVPASPSLLWTAGGNATWSAWIKPASLQANAVIFSRRDGDKSFVIGLDKGAPYVEIAGAPRSAAAAAITAGAWHHLAVVAAGQKISLYLDGEPYSSAAAPLPASNGAITIGGDTTPDTVRFIGEMDEVHISKIARSPGFVKFEAVEQGEKAAKLLDIAASDEQPTSLISWLGSGTFGILMKSLTIDGWVVIGILAVMGTISVFVMVNKTSYLNAISKGNAQFMKEWIHLASDLTALDHGDVEKVKTLGGRVDKAGQRVMKSASVYRIYHIGAEEIRHRLAKHPSGPKALSSLSVQAIRAALDAGVVRETQKLNSLMVVLTIAISGGPFLGLLGTVVGVMITFAAIAAAGDVNVMERSLVLWRLIMSW